MDEQFEFTFNNGDLIYIVLGEDGYTVNILTDEPKMGTFTSFEELLYGIGEYVQNTVSDNIEFGMFASSIYHHFAVLDPKAKELEDEIGEILLK
jgi:hypothetical protein